MGAGAALILAAALAQLPAGAAPAVDVQAKAAAISAKSFVACLTLLRPAHSAAEYAQGAQQLGGMLAATPEVASLPVRVEGVDAKSCRVSWTAPAARIAAEWPSISTSIKTCPARESSRDAVRYACPAHADSPAYEVDFRRVRSGSDARLVSTVSFVGR